MRLDFTFLDFDTAEEVARSASALPVVGSLKATIIQRKPHPSRLQRTADCHKMKARRKKKLTKLVSRLEQDIIRVIEVEDRVYNKRELERAYRETPWSQHVMQTYVRYR